MNSKKDNNSEDLLKFVYNNDIRNKINKDKEIKKVNKNQIRQKIKEKNGEFFFNLFRSNTENNIIKILESFGKLPKEFPINPLKYLLKTFTNENLKFLVVKNLGKTTNPEIFDILKPLIRKEENSIIRREMVSSIGRLRDENNIEFLIEMLKDEDPKVTMQAMRALFYFKDNLEVREALEPLRNHENETIREITEVELYNDEKPLSWAERIKKIEKYLPIIQNTSVLGDVREILKLLPDECVQLTFTSPPYYNAKDYSLYPSYEDYLDFLVEIFKEVHRITEEGRYFILNTSPVLIPRFSRKYSSHRFAIPFDIHPRIIDLGFEFIEDIIWQKPAPSAKNRNGGFFQHRKPLGYKANLIAEYVMVYRKKTHRLLDWNMKKYSKDIIEESKVRGDYEKTNIWNIAPANDKIHPAVFPEELVNWIIRFYSYIGDLIFDPFAGSGTVGEVCQKTKRNFFLTEISENYFNHSRKLLSQKNLLGELKPRFYNFAQFNQLIKTIGK